MSEMDDGIFNVESSKPNTEPIAPRKRDDGRPYCTVHNVLMVSIGSKKAATLYKCPVKGCQSREAKLRPKISAPSSPQLCPEDGEACEVDYQNSGPYSLRMVCPTCGWEVDVPRPDAADRIARMQNQTRSIMDSINSFI